MYQNRDIVTIKNLSKHPDSFILRWQVTALCNYSCAFCIQGTREAHLAAAKEESRERRQTVCDALVQMMETELSADPLLHLYLIGGEVSILKDFPILLEKITSCGFPGEIRVYITTNLSMPAEVYIQLTSLFAKKQAGIRKLFLTASFYEAYTTEQAFERKLSAIASSSAVTNKHVTVAKRVLTEKIHLPLRLNSVSLSVGYPILTDENYRNYQAFRQRCERFIHAVRPIIIRNFRTSLSQETEDALKHSDGRGLEVSFRNGEKKAYSNIQQLGFALEGTEHFLPNGYLCDAGMRSFSVDPLGNVFRCPMYHSPMGSVLDCHFQPSQTAEPCSAARCSCSYFYNITAQQAKAI